MSKRLTGRCGQPFKSDGRSLHLRSIQLPEPPACHQLIEDGQSLSNEEEKEHQRYIRECLKRFADARKAVIDANRAPDCDYWADDTEEDDQ